MRKDSAGESTQVETHMTSKKIKKNRENSLSRKKRRPHEADGFEYDYSSVFFLFLLSFLIACNHYTHQKQK